MASGFFDSTLLANHSHSTVPGDGGGLSNLTVTGSVTAGSVASGPITATTVTVSQEATANLQLATVEHQMLMSMLFGV